MSIHGAVAASVAAAMVTARAAKTKKQETEVADSNEEFEVVAEMHAQSNFDKINELVNDITTMAPYARYLLLTKVQKMADDTMANGRPDDSVDARMRAIGRIMGYAMVNSIHETFNND